MSKKQETNAADDENLNNRKEPEMSNETIADIIAEIRREMPVYASGILCSNMTEVAVHEFADRIDAAYKSELQAHVKNFESTINNLVEENARLKAANAKMREALDKASDTMRLVIESAEDVMQPHLVQEICHCGLAIEKVLAAEGGAK